VPMSQRLRRLTTRCTPGMATWAGSPDEEALLFSRVDIHVLANSCIRSSICAYGRSLGHDVTDKRLEIRAGGIRNMAHPDSPKILGLLDLDGYPPRWICWSRARVSLLVNSTHEGLIDLDRSDSRSRSLRYHRHTYRAASPRCR